MWVTIPLSTHCVGTSPETSSHATGQGTFGHSRVLLAEPLWTLPGLMSGIRVRELISTSNKQQKRGGECMDEHCPQILASKEKATTTLLLYQRIDSLCLGSYWMESDPNREERTELAVSAWHAGKSWQTETGQTTVNKKAPIHYIISINDKVYRPL